MAAQPLASHLVVNPDFQKLVFGSAAPEHQVSASNPNSVSNTLDWLVTI